eukprot:CAMPEP_0196762516 /NCGR_PEP_ID=MMETSP1095-20130614/2157_1 /TAXON_ID=96789 ORGANISM="Chromulina nebulosa, Strain UTEXLB2642" /NCGR_SAMPLE_ID=MMETSP1095 /ASSEMBLY_ACC=CAM_ASM_000446 /LENGTH=391 /DNA_ID=CAMNT_0042113663 /DNA_START=93 /DNA_END=1268 /DNA_ORIENTATION=+
MAPLKLSKVVIADLQILGAAFFFGIGFLGQRAVSVEGLGPMTCNAFRFGLSTILLAVCLPLIPPDGPRECLPDSDHEDDTDDENEEPALTSSKTTRDSSIFAINQLFGPYATHISLLKKTVMFWGITLGFINFAGSGFQQWGITLTSASKCAFIAGFDLFLTPIFSLFVPTFKRNAKPKPSTWFAVSISLVGLYLLSGSRLEEFEIGFGETLAIISTVFWTLHITYTDIATGYVDSLSMMCIQLGVVTFLSAIAAVFIEPQQWFFEHIIKFFPWLLFLAVSEGLGFTLMAVGQNFSPPTHAAIILSLEGVFAAVASYVFLGEILSTRELLGCSLMLLSTCIAKVGCGSYENLFENKTINQDKKTKEKSIELKKHNDIESTIPLLQSDSNHD